MNNHAEKDDIAGVSEGFSATGSFSGSAAPLIAVWRFDGDLAFCLSPDSTVDEINRAISIYERGYRQGELDGVATMQRACREAIGIV
ncbi:hypothetical protein [Burkholderia cepacia]|uniref:hypothetical protein n=1 Tax=Burkholderia cepacia TaxID=292 RepID=UPI0009BEB931|nr:hypothetical protein [Burkholderia cepacia]